jgi:hypothetical protein
MADEKRDAEHMREVPLGHFPPLTSSFLRRLRKRCVGVRATIPLDTRCAIALIDQLDAALARVSELEGETALARQIIEAKGPDLALVANLMKLWVATNEWRHSVDSADRAALALGVYAALDACAAPPSPAPPKCTHANQRQDGNGGLICEACDDTMPDPFWHNPGGG